MFPWNQLDPLTEFVWHEYLNDASRIELRVCAEFLAEYGGRRIDDIEAGIEGMGKTLATREDAAYLLQYGTKEALRRMSRKLLHDHPERFNTTDYLDKIKPYRIHFCPQCRGDLRTPQARQCLQCGYDWHAGPDHQLEWDGMDYKEHPFTAE